MNKNTRMNRKIALKNANKGHNSTDFNVPQTVKGSSLSTRKHTITIGNAKRKSHIPKVGASRRRGNSSNDE